MDKADYNNKFPYRQDKQLRGYSVKKHANQNITPKQAREKNKETLTVQGASVYSSRFSVSLTEDKRCDSPQDGE
jgi:hypothetical protein